MNGKVNTKIKTIKKENEGAVKWSWGEKGVIRGGRKCNEKGRQI